MSISEPLHDGVLLKRAGKGDENAFTLLYRRHQAPLYRFALRMTGNAWAAEEIVQDVFMTLIREPGKYNAERGTVGGYLYGIARNRVMKHFERAPREVSLDEHLENGASAVTGGGGPNGTNGAHGAFNGNGNGVISSGPTPAQWMESVERMERVRAAVLELPTEFREAVVLCELEELSYEEAAKLAGCPIGTIRSRLHRARALLLVKLEVLRELPRQLRAARAR